MHITEILSSLQLFVATISVQDSSNSATSLKTAVYAEGPSQAKQLFIAAYGRNNVVSIALETDLKSSRGTQTLTADQLKLKSLADQKSLISQSEQRERARQKLVKAQQAVQKANSAKLSVGR